MVCAPFNTAPPPDVRRGSAPPAEPHPKGLGYAHGSGFPPELSAGEGEPGGEGGVGVEGGWLCKIQVAAVAVAADA